VYERLFSGMMQRRTSSSFRSTAEMCLQQRCDVLCDQVKVALRFFEFCELQLD